MQKNKRIHVFTNVYYCLQWYGLELAKGLGVYQGSVELPNHGFLPGYYGSAIMGCASFVIWNRLHGLKEQ